MIYRVPATTLAMASLWIMLQAAPPAPTGGPNAATIFYLTLLFIFLTAIVTAIVTKWSRDKCLKFFFRYHVTLERIRGQTIWGQLKVFSAGIEIVYDHSFVDPRGRKKTSYMIYQHELDQQVLSLLRFHDELSPEARIRRDQQVQRTFNPGPIRRFMRKIRNFINTLRDAFNTAIGAAVGQVQRLHPGSAVLTTQASHVTAIGQQLIGKAAANAYEPLLEQYIGRAVILDVADPINPNNAIVEYTGYLADYTQQFIAILNVKHKTGEGFWVQLPDVEQGDPLPPLPGPPPPGAPPPGLPPALTVEREIAIRLDGLRLKIHNTRYEPVAVRRMERAEYEPVEFGMVIPSNGTLDLPARDTRGGRLLIEPVRCLDVVAPRKFATIRHAGELVERRGLLDELSLDQLPLVARLPRSRPQTTP